jgi:5-carboxymethyl-2-hydroxymuconic-semialdehyde dehydrogenase
LPEGVFNIVQGFGETAGAALVAHPGVQLISFTGETTTGKEIMRNGAATLKRLSLELGGKSPIIVFPDADLERALDAAVFGVYSLNGERCTASSRLILHRGIYDEFTAKLTERVKHIKVGDPFDKATEVGPLIHPTHRDRVLAYVEIGRHEGATIAAGGAALDGPGNYMQPTLFLNVDNRMRIAQEEIFGPALCVIPFNTEQEAVRIANDVRYGLAAYVWTNDIKRGHRVASQLQSGMVWVNSQNVRELRTPFGGAKDSGIGREGGEYSFHFYCETRNVCIALGEHRIPKFGVL